MADQQPQWLEPGEQIVAVCRQGGRFKSKLNMQFGAVVLTDRRLVFANRGGKWLMAFGAIGGLIQGLRKKIPENVEVSIPRDQIASAEQGKQGLNKNILEVTTTSGESHRFSTKPVEDFLTPLAGS